MSMIGHNSIESTGNVLSQLRYRVSSLGLALQDQRTYRKDDREQMIRVARHVAAVYDAAAGDMALAEAEIRSAGIVLPTDLIANKNERDKARWLGRGGLLEFSKLEKNVSEINDLSVEGLNPVELKFLTIKKYAKLTSYTGIYGAITREMRVDINKALDSRENLTIDGVRAAYANFFEEETMSNWVAEEEWKRTPEYKQIIELRKAWSMRMEEETEQLKNNPQALRSLETHVKSQLARIRTMAAEAQAAAEQKQALANLSADKREKLLRAVTDDKGEQPDTATEEDF